MHRPRARKAGVPSRFPPMAPASPPLSRAPADGVPRTRRARSSRRPHAHPLEPALRRVVEGRGGALALVDELLAAPDVGAERRRLLEPLRAVSLLRCGRAREAWRRARRLRPAVPLRDLADALSLWTCGLVGIEGGEDWPAVEAVMAEAHRRGVRHGDHQALGVSAYNLGHLMFLRGRYADAARRLAEAGRHLERRDAFGTLAGVRALQAGVAEARGDPAAARVALGHGRALLAGREPPPSRLPWTARTEAWAAGDARHARRILCAAADRLAGEAPANAMLLRFEAIRAGAPAAAVAPAIAEAATRTDARLAGACATHAAALAARDAPGLLEAAATWHAIGADRYATIAAAAAASRFVAEGRHDSARRAAALARELHAAGQGAEPPVVDGVDGVTVGLTPRERQLAALAARGLSNAAIAEQLTLSVRTVESHLYRAMQKRGVRDRRDL